MTTYKSQIRQSTINALREKAARKNYGKYLLKINLVHVRGLRDQTINFEFPVTALIGPNGGGKTTILGAAATAYAAIKPRQFFTKSGRFDDSMANWRMEYELIDRDVNRNDTFRRTAAFHSSKWSRDAVERPTVTLGVARTVPASERREMQRCASGSFSPSAELVDAIQRPVADAVEKILGKNISHYSHIRVDQAGRVSLLTGQTDGGVGYSEFHFGAGESSIIRMVMQIEAMEQNSLVLIEEIENGLHPVATIRLVEYLIEAAERKSIQAIFTTHSNDALLPLPAEAIWASINGRVFQGKLDVGSLRAITGQIDARLAIFCEDDFSAAWIRAMLRNRKGIAVDATEVHPMAGDGAAVSINRYHNQSPAKRFPSVCILDGDSRQNENSDEHIYRLPGANPEAYVFDRCIEAISEHGRLVVRLNQPFADAENILRLVQDVRIANRDAHLLFTQIAEKLGFMPVDVVREAFFATWNDAYQDERNAILDRFANFLPIECDATTKDIEISQTKNEPPTSGQKIQREKYKPTALNLESTKNNDRQSNLF
ncbi:AAA family ATPase [Burkholderia sp. Cy-637]|nr:AAA family ATPase [Burkholderia sp. Cy-637]NIF70540.1 ATP-binding protein [Burkholderia sp. Ap-962]NIF88655.1 ATP-binding protein [Burkholderia sp. Cy-637]